MLSGQKKYVISGPKKIVLSGQKTFPKLRFKDAAKTVGRQAVLSRKKMDIADVWLKDAAVSVCVCVCV